VIDVASDRVRTPEEVSAVIEKALQFVPAKTSFPAQLRHGADGPRCRIGEAKALTEEQPWPEKNSEIGVRARFPQSRDGRKRGAKADAALRRLEKWSVPVFYQT